MIKDQEISPIEIRKKIKNKGITFAGNTKLKIYGKLNCKSGKRLKTENRIFFETENEAILQGYRPCGNCLKIKYNEWICSTQQ